MRKAPVLFLLTFLLVAPAAAQMEALVNKGLYGDLSFSTGSSSHKADCCPSSSHTTSIFGLNAGFLVDPRFGVGLEFLSRKPENVDATLYISPRVKAVPIRQGEKYPVTVSADVIFHLLLPPDEDMSANGFGLDLAVSRSIKPMKGIGLLPHLALRFSSITYSYDAASKGLGSSESTESPFGLKLGVTGSAKKGPGLLTVTPFFELNRFSSGEGTYESTVTTTQFGLKAGLTFKK